MRSERGSVSVVAAGVMVLTVVVTVGAADVGRALVAQARARTAADAAALAAAQELALPSGRLPAEVAAEYAGRNDGELLSCSCDPGSQEAVVEVRVSVGALFLASDDRWVTARARAVVDLVIASASLPWSRAGSSPDLMVAELTEIQAQDAQTYDRP
jgi:secretion/DNA translocation related TadE-like protein